MSSDVNGPIQTRTWDFGDGTPSVEGNVVQHLYEGGGAYTVGLEVADSQGLTGSTTNLVTVTAPAESTISFVGETSRSGNLVTHTASVPAGVEPGDALLMFFSGGTSPSAVGAPTGVGGWTEVDALTDSHGTTRLWRKVAAAGDEGGQVRITMSAQTKGNLTIVAYRGTSAVDPIAAIGKTAGGYSATRTTPTIDLTQTSWVVSYWMHRDSSSTSLSVPPSVTARSTGTQTGGGRVTTLLADSGADVPTGPYGGLAATAQAASSYGTAWTIELAPA
jgi:PKD repeat protein